MPWHGPNDLCHQRASAREGIAGEVRFSLSRPSRQVAGCQLCGGRPCSERREQARQGATSGTHGDRGGPGPTRLESALRARGPGSTRVAAREAVTSR